MNPLKCQDKKEFDERCKALEVGDPEGYIVKIQDTPQGFFPAVLKKTVTFFQIPIKSSKKSPIKY